MLDTMLLTEVFLALEAEPMLPASSIVKEVRISDEHKIVFVRYAGSDDLVYAFDASTDVIQGFRAEAKSLHGSINGYLRKQLTHVPNAPVKAFVKFQVFDDESEL